MIAPLSQKPCVLYTMTLEYLDDYQLGQRRRDRRESTNLRCADDAAIDDGTGRVTLHTESLRLHLRTEVSVSAGMGATAEAERLAADLLPSRRHSPLRLRERRLDLDEPVLAVARIEASRAGPFIGGESRAEVWAGGEQGREVTGRGGDLVAAGLVIAGLFVGGLAALELLTAPEPVAPGGMRQLDARETRRGGD